MMKNIKVLRLRDVTYFKRIDIFDEEIGKQVTKYMPSSPNELGAQRLDVRQENLYIPITKVCTKYY
jgi:hypothetical protein